MTARLFRVILLSCGLFASSIAESAFAQGYLTNSNTTGMPDYGSFMTSQIDAVNLANGGLSIRIPLISQKGRGIDTYRGYRYESKFWVVERYVIDDPPPPITRFVWRPDNPNGLWKLESNFGGYLSYDEVIYTCLMPALDPPVQIAIQSNWIMTMADGTGHQVPLRKKRNVYEGHRCLDSIASLPQQPIAHTDAGQIEVDVTNDNPLFWRQRYKDGSTSGPWNQTLSLRDTNGNKCCEPATAPGEWNRDTLGRQLYRFRNTGPNMTAMDYFDSDGLERNIAIERTRIQLRTAFTRSDPGLCGFDQGIGSIDVLRKITLPNGLPNGLSYTFSYDEPDPDNPGQMRTNPFGEITQVTLPSGGYIKYKWDTFPEWDLGPDDPTGCATNLDARMLVERRLSEDGVNEQVWMYSYTSSATTVRDPLGNEEVHRFGITAGPHIGGTPLETQVDYFQGSSTALRRIVKDWATDRGPVSINQPSGCFPPVTCSIQLGGRNPRIIRTTTTLFDTTPNKVSKTQTDYTDCYNYSILGQSYTDCRDNPTAVHEYDYGGGEGWNPIRTTTFNYLHLDTTHPRYLDYRNVHIWDRVTERKVLDSASNVKAWTKFSYDTTPITATPAGVPYHDPTFDSVYRTRGNQALVERWQSNGNRWLATTNKFNDVGNLIETTDPGGHTTLFDFTDKYTDGVDRNSQGHMTNVTYPTTSGISHIERNQYFWSTGQVAASCGQNFPTADACDNTYNNFTSPLSDYIKFTYDALRRPLTAVRGDGGQTTFAYNETALPISITSTTKITAAQDLVRTDVIDGLGRVKQSRLDSDPEGVTYTDITYDALGRKATVSNPYRTTSQGATAFEYEPLGRIKKVIPPDGTPITTEYSGNTTTVADQAGTKRKSETDALGRLVRIWEPDSGGNFIYETAYYYDALDNLWRVDQHGNDSIYLNWRTRTFAYNSLSQLIAALNPESGPQINYSYDNDGNMLTRSDGRSFSLITYTYDALHRLIQKSYEDGSTTVKYGYDGVTPAGCTPPALTTSNGIGRRTSMCDAGGAQSWSYDAMGRVLTDRRTTNTFTKDFVYDYNLDGSRFKLTYPSGRIIEYKPTGAGRPEYAKDIANGINYALSAAYAPHGALASLVLGQSASFTGINLNQAYNNRLQPTTMRAWSTNGVALDLTYCFNVNVHPNGNCATTPIINNGNVAQIKNNLNTARTQNFTYDELNRIKSVVTQATSGEHCWGQLFGEVINNNYVSGYDIWGNLKKITPDPSRPGPGCTVEQLDLTINTLNRISGYCYDAAGNLLSETGSPCPPPAPTYTYDAENRMTTGAGVTYTYDGAGKRVKKSNGKLYWYGMGSEVLTESDLSGNLTDEYIFFGGKRIARRKVASGEINYYFSDHLGSSRVVTSATGQTLDDADFYPFGGERAVASTSGNTYKFTGKERDTESGLDYFGARYYGSNMGRFTSPDSPFADQQLEDPQSWNLYSYTRNNPLSYIDDDGREIKYAPGLKNAHEVRAVVSAILANPNTSSELSGYVGPNSPDLIIKSEDLSKGDTVTDNPDGSVTITRIQGQTKPDIQTTTFSGGPPETALTGATITIDKRTSKSDLPGVMVHEAKHAGDAKRDPAGFLKEVRAERGKPHDQRTQEQRAIQFAKQHSKDITKQAKEIRKQQKEEEKRKKKDEHRKKKEEQQ